MKLLVPVEFSECSHASAKVALSLAEALDGEITLLHVWDPPPFSPPETLYIAAGGGKQTLWEHVKRQATEEIEKALPGAKRVEERIVVYGDPATTIVDHANEGGFDMIVVGTHGRTGLAHAALGSVAEKVLRRAKCPVITVPAHDA